MLNTPSLRRSFRGFCEHNGLGTMLHKFIDNEGNVRPQFVHQDNGIEHDHKHAMALRKWDGPEPTIVNGQHVTMR
eukprot:5200801-Amphidinium_carterae.1